MIGRLPQFLPSTGSIPLANIFNQKQLHHYKKRLKKWRTQPLNFLVYLTLFESVSHPPSDCQHSLRMDEKQSILEPGQWKPAACWCCTTWGEWVFGYDFSWSERRSAGRAAPGFTSLENFASVMEWFFLFCCLWNNIEYKYLHAVCDVCVCVRRRPRTPLASWCDSLTPAFLIRQCRQGLDVTTVLLFCLLQSIDTLFLLAFPVLHLFLFFFFTPAWQYCRQKDKNIRGRHELTSSVETWLFFLLL